MSADTGFICTVSAPALPPSFSNQGWARRAPIGDGFRRLLARETRVCAYDRAGRGWSDSASAAQDGMAVATDLHTLLERAHVPGPFVLVGHSSGAAVRQDLRRPVSRTGCRHGPARRPTGRGVREAFQATQRSTAASAASLRCCRRWLDSAWDGWSSTPILPVCPRQHATCSVSTTRRRGCTAACATSSPNCPRRSHRPVRFRTSATGRWSS